MRAFLSHSSKDKGFVEAVATNLRPGTYELDSLTFDPGLVNSNAIIKALERSDLFCLFLSESSVISSYVDFEVLLGMEFLAKASISRFLVICLDDRAFSLASENARFFNIVRKVMTPEGTARLIEGQLISSISNSDKRNHPFVGREDEIKELETQIADHSRPLIKGLFISGNAGSGRRTLARKFYEAQFPHVGKVFPQLEIDAFDGLEELYRTILMKLRPSITMSELRTRVGAFTVSDSEERRRQIAQLLNSLLLANEAAIILDLGGVLTDAGGFDAEIEEIIVRLDARPHPPIIFISPRMIPKGLRRAENDIAYSAVRVLKFDTTNRLIGRLLKERSINVTPDQIDELSKLSESHPYNIYRLVDEASERGVNAFLSNPRGFIDWKHRESSEYLNRVTLNDNEKLVLGILKVIPELDFEAIVLASALAPETVSEVLQRLDYLHIIDSHDNRFLISPALRIAVERDVRIRLSKNLQASVTKSLANSLTIRIETGQAPITLLKSAILSGIESGEASSELVAAFMLPSHYVWLCKHHYDQRNWEDSIRHGLEALKGESRLSFKGFVAACRFVCLASARVRNDQVFKGAISKLERAAHDDWAKSNVSYLKGFNLRNKGNLLAAERLFQEANDLSPGNLSALRELAAIALTRGNLTDAEALAREALRHASSNAFLLDILIAVLIRKHAQRPADFSEIEGLFAILERVGEESGRSFFTTRKAEFEHLWGDNVKALSLIGQAIKKTPSLFEPRRLHVEILLKDGNKTKAGEALQFLRQMVESHDVFDRRFNYRSYLETNSHYLVELGQFNEAKKLFDDPEIFTDEEKRGAIREIEIIESFSKQGKRK